MPFMKRAERMIRIQIDQLTLSQIAPKKSKIEDAIEFMYWQGAFSKRKYLKMHKLLSDKYTEIMNNYHEDLTKKFDEDLERLLKHYEN